MNHLTNYFTKSLFYLTAVLLLTTCNKEESSVKSNWTISEIDPVNESFLEEKVNSIFSSSNGRKAIQSVIVWDKAIKIVDPRNGKSRYTFRCSFDSLNQFSNFVLTETKTGLTGFIIVYEPANDWYKNGGDFAKFSGKLLSYDLNGTVTGMSLVQDGRTVKGLSSKGGRTNDLPPFPESPGCYQLILSTHTGLYWWDQRPCGGGGSSSGTGSSSGGVSGGSSTGGESGSGGAGGNDSNYGNNNSGGGAYGGGVSGIGGEGFQDTPIGVYYNWPGSDLGYPKNWWLDDQWLDENFHLDPYDRFKKLTFAEKQLVKTHPVAALLIDKNKETAFRETERLFPNQIALNDKADAFRHAFFNAMNERDCGKDPISLQSLAKKFSDAHESEVPTQLLLEKEMDLWNNSVGQDLGNVMFPLFTPDGDLSQSVINKITAGDLKYLSPIWNSDPNFWGANGIPNPLTATHGIISSTSLTWTNQ